MSDNAESLLYALDDILDEGSQLRPCRRGRELLADARTVVDRLRFMLGVTGSPPPQFDREKMAAAEQRAIEINRQRGATG